jgi:DNA-nicking Smr family endonuclease
VAKLSDLKTLLAAKREAIQPKAKMPSGANAAASKREIARTKHASGDVDLRAAFGDVAPLPPGNRARLVKPRPSSAAVKSLQDEADALAASKYGSAPSPSSWEIGQELEAEQTFRRAGLGSDVLTKLRRGHWAVQDELDLHGLTVDEARDALADYLTDARSRGWRCVRVIHGKGLSSPNREPILKSKVRRWLTQWESVLAYCEAPLHGGGSGAVIVLLKS